MVLRTVLVCKVVYVRTFVYIWHLEVCLGCRSSGASHLVSVEGGFLSGTVGPLGRLDWLPVTQASMLELLKYLG